MNGRELLEAMSYVDQELIAASQEPVKKAARPRWALTAACLCLVVLGAFALQILKPALKSTESAMEDSVAECAPAAGAPESPQAPTEAAANGSAAQEAGEAAADEECAPAPIVRVRVDTAGEEALTVTVLDVVTRDFALQADMVLTVTCEDPAILAQAEAGDEVWLWIDAFDEETLTLHITELEPAQ